MVNLLSNERSSMRSSRSSSQPMTPVHHEHADDELDTSELANVGGMWAEVVGAWLATDTSARDRLQSFQKKYAGTRGGSDSRMWQPMASRVAGLEVELRKMQRRRQGFGCCCGRRRDPEPKPPERDSVRRSARMLMP